ncbi:MAG: ATP-binding protein [Proteobacteria bacterium]|nr:ATP-binding protein [Pseudomonadota bacterium]
MQRRLARFISERTRLLTAMSHDLKTPITRLRLRTEMLDDASLQRKFVQDLDEMEAMVTQTLEFMRDGSASEAVQPVNLMALLESMQTDYRDTGQRVDISGQVRRTYPVRPLAMRRCLGNLVDNALRYGQCATIEIEEQPAELLLKIRDVGPGIPDSELEKVFEPFYRGEASRSRATGGTGLGLGIARNIAHAHGGEITLSNLPGGGLEARLRLPGA